MDGRAVQLRRGRERVLDGGDPFARLEQFAMAGEVAVVDLDAALGRGSNTSVIRNLVRHSPCRVGGGIRTVEAAERWLDAGAARVMVGTAASPELCGALPRERVIAAVDAERETVVVDGWRSRTGRNVVDVVGELAPYVGGFLVTQVEREGMLEGFDFDLVTRVVAVAGNARVTAAGGITTVDDVARLDAISVDAQVGMALYTGRFTLGEAVAGTLQRASSEGLWPTVVCDEHGTALGLVWSSRESVARAIDTRSGVYWSRSRQALWTKGETSGNRQVLRRVELDCDRDALRFIVKQQGAGFCHRETRSCWGDDFTLATLERILAERGHSGDPTSGTVRLFRDEVLLAAKLREEAEELGQAVTPDETIHEAADVLYFLLTALARRGVRLTDVRAELERRHRRITRRPMAVKPPADASR